MLLCVGVCVIIYIWVSVISTHLRVSSIGQTTVSVSRRLGRPTDPLFIEQARRFMSVISAVVVQVDDLSSARSGSPALVDLGKRHVTIEDFLPDYFDVITRAVPGVCYDHSKLVTTKSLARWTVHILWTMLTNINVHFSPKQLSLQDTMWKLLFSCTLCSYNVSLYRS